MNTVGRPGLPGESVRCIISVNMLTEGWNTKTVTHLLGFRKFGSSLLCEQVAGRTLRRVTRTKDEDEIQVRARVRPDTGHPVSTVWRTRTRPEGEEKISSGLRSSRDPNRRHLRVEWPNVIQLRRTGGNRPVEVMTKPEGPDEGHEVPAHISERINVDPTAGLTARFQGRSSGYCQEVQLPRHQHSGKDDRARDGGTGPGRGRRTRPSSSWRSSSARP